MKGEDNGCLSTFRGINAQKVGLLRTKTMPKHFQNNFEKGQKMTFLAPELAKITISEGEILKKKKKQGHICL